MNGQNSGNTSRRRWLAGMATLLAASLSPKAKSADPITRSGQSYFKLSLAAYSFNKLMPNKKPLEEHAGAKFDLFRFIDFCAAQNLDGCELTSYYFPKDVADDYLLKVKEQAFRLGLDITGTAIGNDFCVNSPELLQKEIESAKKWVDHSVLLGAPVIRIFAGKVAKGDTEEIARNRCIESINTLLNYAEPRGVVLALENHGGITSTSEQLLSIVQGVRKSPCFGINFDSGNFKTPDPYRDLERIAPYAMNVQFKTEIHREDKKEHADYGRFLSILRQTGYRGYIVLEYEEAEDPFVAIPRHLQSIREKMKS